jgi:hypothetical protein
MGDAEVGALGESPARPSALPPSHALTDSPWFWLLLFAGFGIGAMLAIGPKYSLRQGGIETRFQNRQMARQWNGEEIESAQAIEAVRLPTAPGERSLLISLRPLFIGIGGVIALVLLGTWYAKSKATPLQTDL